VSTIEDAYDEIVKWRKNTFLVPYWEKGREFIDKFTKHIKIPLDKGEGKGATYRGRRSNTLDDGEVCDECDQTGRDRHRSKTKVAGGSSRCNAQDI